MRFHLFNIGVGPVCLTRYFVQGGAMQEHSLDDEYYDDEFDEFDEVGLDEEEFDENLFEDEEDYEDEDELESEEFLEEDEEDIDDYGEYD